jgi:hypothetical protein
VRLVRGWRVPGAILVLAEVFTISNVMRLTMYARQDELDIMRLRARPCCEGSFRPRGTIQGGLASLASASSGIFHALARPARDVRPARRTAMRCRRPWPRSSSSVALWSGSREAW